MKTTNAVTRLASLAHEGRLDLFRLLVKASPEGLNVGQIAEAQQVNFTTASAQLAVLTQSGLLAKQRQGRSIVYTADFANITSLLSFLMEDCCGGSDPRIVECCKILDRPEY